MILLLNLPVGCDIVYLIKKNPRRDASTFSSGNKLISLQAYFQKFLENIYERIIFMSLYTEFYLDFVPTM